MLGLQGIRRRWSPTPAPQISSRDLVSLLAGPFVTRALENTNICAAQDGYTGEVLSRYFDLFIRDIHGLIRGCYFILATITEAWMPAGVKHFSAFCRTLKGEPFQQHHCKPTA
jgi:hypothetical protein